MEKRIDRQTIFRTMETCAYALIELGLHKAGKNPLGDEAVYTYNANGVVGSEIYMRVRTPEGKSGSRDLWMLKDKEKMTPLFVNLDIGWEIEAGRFILDSNGGFRLNGKKLAEIEPTDMASPYVYALKLVKEIAPERLGAKTEYKDKGILRIREKEARKIAEKLETLSRLERDWDTICDEGADHLTEPDGVCANEKREEILRMRDAIARLCLGNEFDIPAMLQRAAPPVLEKYFMAKPLAIEQEGRELLAKIKDDAAYQKLSAIEEAVDDDKVEGEIETALWLVKNLESNLACNDMFGVRNFTRGLRQVDFGRLAEAMDSGGHLAKVVEAMEPAKPKKNRPRL